MAEDKVKKEDKENKKEDKETKDNKKTKNEDEKKTTIFTKETFGVILLLFATLCLICLITGDMIFSVPGAFVRSFLLGCFGFFAYLVVLYGIISGVQLIVSKNFGFAKKTKFLLTLSFCLLALLVQVIALSGFTVANYGDYIGKTYTNGLGGGLIVSLIAYPLSQLLTNVGTSVIVGLGFLASVYFFIKGIVDNKKKEQEENAVEFNSSFVKEDTTTENLPIAGVMAYPVQDDNFVKPQGRQKLFIVNANDFSVKSKKELQKPELDPRLEISFSDSGLGVATTNQPTPMINKGDDYKSKLDYIKTPPTYTYQNINNTYPTPNEYIKPNTTINNIAQTNQSINNGGTSVSDYITSRPTTDRGLEDIPYIDHTEEKQVENKTIENSSENTFKTQTINSSLNDSASSRAERFGRDYADIEEVDSVPETVEQGTNDFRNDIPTYTQEPEESTKEISSEDIPFIEDNFSVSQQESTSEVEEELPPSNIINTSRRRGIFDDQEEDLSSTSMAQNSQVEEDKPQLNTSRNSFGFTSRVEMDGNRSSARQNIFEEPKEEKPPKKEIPINREYFRPPLDLLERYLPPVDAPKENHQERMDIIQKTLEEFHINAIPQNYVQGPSITRYEITMPAGVSVKKVLAFDDDLKMRLAAKDGVRIEAPIPGKNLVGIEVANNVKTTVGLREILEESAEQGVKKGGLMFALGKDLVGSPILDDLSKGPHYLVAGATGSGKSVCLNLMIVSLIMRYSPEDLRLILVDPKGVEFINYEHIPHLMIDEIITEPKKALSVLSWAYTEMERRFAVFRESGGGLVVDIDSYNQVVASDTVAKMPRIVIIIDELADLMETCKKDLESRIRAIAQKARAAGIHLVLATQRPSVDIITGTIKANLPSRIAFKVMNFNDSQTILSEAGAEKLLGNGDMLYKTARMSSTERYQGAYISSREVNSIVNYIKEKNTAYFDDELKEFLDKESRPKQEESYADSDGGDDANEVNDFFLKALWLAVNTETVSISQLQRRFQIGYSRAGGLVDKMERMGFVSPNEGSKARRVLLTREQFVEKFGSMPD